VKLANLVSEALDDLLCLLFLGLGGLDKLPALIDFSSENSNSVGILLSQFNRSLNPGCVLKNRVVEILTSVLIKLISNAHNSN
jgi:hypothetical protein